MWIKVRLRSETLIYVIFCLLSNQTVQDKLMKINKMLIAVPAMLAVVLSSCKDDDPTVGIDSSMPAPAEVSYDEMNSSSSSIGVYWDANAALKSGATSFTVQILKKKDVGGDAYDNTVSHTPCADDDRGDHRQQYGTGTQPLHRPPRRFFFSRFGNQPFATRSRCSNSSPIPHNDDAPHTASRIERIRFSTHSDAASAATPDTAKAHQHRTPK